MSDVTLYLWSTFFSLYAIAGVAIGVVAVLALVFNPWRSHEIRMRNWPKPPPFPSENKRAD